MKTDCQIVHADCMDFMRSCPADAFDVAVFSPPYGVGNQGFDIRSDFGAGGRFIPYASEINRVSKLWAINLTQRVVEGRMSTFIEEFVLTCAKIGAELFDRWIIVKPAAMPKRGNRALTRYEFILLFSKSADRVVKVGDGGYTVFAGKAHGSSATSDLGATPYFPEIPQQVIRLYCPQGGSVFDPFAGSGTTLIEAGRLGRRSVGVEKDQSIFDLLTRRCGGAK